MDKDEYVVFQTRSIRLGSYKVLVKRKALFTCTGVQLTIPDRLSDERDEQGEEEMPVGSRSCFYV